MPGPSTWRRAGRAWRIAPRSVRHGGLDVTGMLDAIAGWSPTAPIPPADLDALVDWPARRVAMALPGPFDRVASTCLLSQIVGDASTRSASATPGSPTRSGRSGWATSGS